MQLHGTISRARLKWNIPGADCKQLVLVESVVNLNAPRANFNKCRLLNCIIEDADLSEANLSQSDLRGSSFKGSDLKFANLFASNIGGCNFSNCNLVGSNLSDLTISDSCVFENTVLGDARELTGYDESIFGALEDGRVKAIARVPKFARVSDDRKYLAELFSSDESSLDHPGISVLPLRFQKTANSPSRMMWRKCFIDPKDLLKVKDRGRWRARAVYLQ